MENVELFKKQIILNALNDAQNTINEVFRDQETGERDATFGGDEKLKNIYYALNDACLYLSENNDFWWKK